MEMYLKITVGIVVLVQAHMAFLLDPTDSPGRTIDRSWLRELVKTSVGSQNTAVEEQTGQDQETDGAGMESSDDNMYGTYSTMSMSSGEGGEIANQEKDANETSSGVTTTLLTMFLNDTNKEPELPETTVSQTAPTTGPTHSSQANVTAAKEEFQTSLQNSTAPPTTQSSTSLPDLSNDTDIHKTTVAPESNDTQESTVGTDIDNWPINSTETTSNVTTTEIPELNEESTTPSSTTEFPSETTEEMIPVTMATIAPSTPKEANMTDKDTASGSDSERGLSSGVQRNKRQEAWGAILGTAVAAACVGLVVYIILKKRNQKEFSHRKLVEEFSSDPVIRLDNSEPLDLNYGGSAYYNPGLQMDNIQMTNFPGNRKK